MAPGRVLAFDKLGGATVIFQRQKPVIDQDFAKYRLLGKIPCFEKTGKGVTMTYRALNNFDDFVIYSKLR